MLFKYLLVAMCGCLMLAGCGQKKHPTKKSEHVAAGENSGAVTAPDQVAVSTDEAQKKEVLLLETEKEDSSVGAREVVR